MPPESPLIRSLDDSQQRRLPLRFYLGWRLALIAVLPALLVAVYLTVVQDHAAERELEREVRATTRTAGEQIERYLQTHVAALESLAAVAGHKTGPVESGWLQAELHAFRQGFRGFLTMIAVDADAWITAASPEHDQAGEPLLRRRSLDLGRLAAFDPAGQQQPLELLVLDREGQVIYATDSQRFPFLEAVAGRSQALRHVLGQAQGGFYRAQRLFRGEGPGAVMLSRFHTAHGWDVIGLRDLTPMIREQRERWLITGLLALVVAAFSILVTTSVASRIQRPLDRLTNSFRANRPGRPIDVPTPPRGTPQELAELFRDFRKLAERLNRFFDRLSQSLAESGQLQQELERTLRSREEVIEARTRDLRQRTRELQAANRALEKQALEDPLTGLANRRAFVECLEKTWRICMREQQPVSVIMLDVDNFKAYNDHYGHPAGDQALRRLADALKAAVHRPLDLVARLGGEEFAVILGHCDEKNVREFAETLRGSVEALAIIHGRGGAGPVMTASLGLSTRVPTPDKDLRQLTIEADQALYRAKQGGRNRCVHFQAVGQDFRQTPGS